MLSLLDLTECKDFVLGYFLATIKSILDLLQIVAPIVLIISLIISFSKLVINPDNDKKEIHGMMIRIVGIFFFFFLPWVVELVLNVFVINSKDDQSLYLLGSCYKYSKEIREVLDSSPSKGVGNNMTPVQLKTTIGEITVEKAIESMESDSSKGMGAVKKVTIKYNQKDPEGRCGKGKNDYCSAIATVKYEKGTVKYYMGYQYNSGLLDGSCRAHALTSAINAIKNTKMSTLDLQNYMYKLTPNSGVLVGNKIDKAISHYGIKATVFHSELTQEKAANIIKEAVKNGQPVMVFVQHSKCPDLAGTHHAYLILDIDDDGHVVMIDSCNYPRNASYKKRTPSELAKCLSKDDIADSYYRLILFEF